MKDKILKGINTIVFVVLLLAMCCGDSESWLPFIVIFACLGWLALYRFVLSEG